MIAKDVMPDHVHLFVSADTHTKPDIVVKRFKGRSSNLLRKEFLDLLKMPTFWTRSYFLSTAGNVSSSTIKIHRKAMRNLMILTYKIKHGRDSVI